MAFSWEVLLRPEVQEFISEHADDDERTLVLKKPVILGLPAAVIAGQIVSRRKSKDKLPLYYSTSGIVYPPPLNLEQSSSEATARVKSGLLKQFFDPATPLNGADLTSGFGVDSFFFSRISQNFICVEPDRALIDISKHSHNVLAAHNVRYFTSTARDFLAQSSENFDFIFLDPSRRHREKRVFRLADCDPDPIALLPTLFEKTNLVLIKASPLLDLHRGLTELESVVKIAVLSVRNECKEVLFFCAKNSRPDVAVECINLLAGNYLPELFSFNLTDERGAVSVFSDPLDYLYEPNASILKAGAFKTIGERFGLEKIHPHTHLYTSRKLVSDFPGRIFAVEELQPSRVNLKFHFPDGKGNVITRNYPLTAEALKKKSGLRDGGEKFLIGFSGRTSKFTAVATRIKRQPEAD